MPHEAQGTKSGFFGSAALRSWRRCSRLRVMVASRHPRRRRTKTVPELAAETAALQV